MSKELENTFQDIQSQWGKERGKKKKKEKTNQTNQKPPCRSLRRRWLRADGLEPGGSTVPAPRRGEARPERGWRRGPRAARELLRERRFSQDFTSRGALGAAGGGLSGLGGPGEGREQRHVSAAPRPSCRQQDGARRRARWER